MREGEPAAWRLPARDIELAVQRRLQKLLNDRRELRRVLGEEVDAVTLTAAIAHAEALALRIDNLSSAGPLIHVLVRVVQVCEDRVRITLNWSALLRRLLIETAPPASELSIDAPATKVRQGKATKLVLSDADGMAAERDEKLITLLKEAREARDAMLACPDRSINQIASSRRQCRHRFMRLVKLSWLAPEIVAAILEGRHPTGLTPKRLLDAELPPRWSDQKVKLGFASN
jgi:hypothetical protein